MSYIVNEIGADRQNLVNENIALKKEIEILEVANAQLLEEMNNYKNAYERYSDMFIIKIIKKILRK